MFTLALNISPLDGDKLPSVSMLPTIGKDHSVPMSATDFWACLSYAISYLRDRAYKARQVAAIKAKRRAEAERRK